MSDYQIAMELEDEHGSAYLKLRDSEIAKTKKLNDNIMLDWSSDGELVGVEFLFHSLRTANLALFVNKQIPQEDLTVILRMLASQGTFFTSKSAGVLRLPKTSFQFSAQPVFA